MKQKLKRLLMLMATIGSLAANAQTTLTVCDGTATPSTRVPFYGYGADEGDQRSQFIYPARMLAAMDGGAISQMRFFLTQEPNITNGTLNMKFQLIEVEDTVFSNYSYKPIAGATTVYDGTMVFEESEMVITFTTPYSYNGGHLMVDVQSLADDNGYGTCGFTGMQTVHYSSVNSIEEDEYDDYGMITALPGSLGYGDKFHFLPKVEFTYTSTVACQKPIDLVASDIRPDSVTLTWTPMGSEETWMVYVDGEWKSQCALPTYTFGMLSPNTTYELGVRANCGDDDSSAMSTLTVHTGCGVMAYSSLPYQIDFEDVNIPVSTSVSLTAVPCWLPLDIYAPYATFPSVYKGVNHTETSGGDQSLAFNGDATHHPIAALPEMEPSVTSLTLSFWMRVGNGMTDNEQMLVGVLTDDDDEGSFVVADTLHFAAGAMDEWQYYETVFDVDAEGRLAFRWTGTSYAYVDDIEVSIRQSCDRPQSVVVDEVGDDWVTLTANDQLDIMHYGLRLSGNGDTIETAFIGMKTTTVSNLQPATEYSVELWGICYDGTVTTAVTTAFMTTASPVEEIPYFTGFEQTDDRYWIRLNNDGAAWTIDTATHHGEESAEALYISNDGGQSVAYTTSGSKQSYATRRFVLPAGQYSIDFDWMCGGEVGSTGINYDYMRVVLAPDSAELSISELPFHLDATQVPDGWQSLSPALSGETTWQHHRHDFVVDSDGVYTVVILWRNDISGGTGVAAAVDNFALSQLNCYQPQQLTVDSIGENAIAISWENSGTETYWLVGVSGVDTLIRTTEPNMILDNLNASTLYDIAVYSYCGEGDTSVASTVEVLTHQVPVTTLPYETGFEAGEDAGWFFANGVNGWCLGDAASAEGGRSMYISSDNGANNNYIPGQTSASYAFRSIALAAGEYEMSFDWRCQGELNSDYMRAWIAPVETTFKADTLPNGNGSYLSSSYWQQSPEGWVDVANGKLNLESTWQHSVAEFSIDSTGLYYIVFMWVNDMTSGINPSAAVDNIVLRSATCPAVTDIEMTDATTSSISISWTAGGSESAWVVRIGNTETVVETASYTATGLDIATRYQVSVRPLCGEGDTGVAVTAEFSTECGNWTLPHTEDFEAAASGEMACWTATVPYVSAYGSTYPHVYSSSVSAHEGSRYMYGYMAEDGNHMMLASPVIEAGENGLSVNMWLQFYSQNPSQDFENSEVRLRIGVMTNPNDSSTFVVVKDTVGAADEWVEVSFNVAASAFEGSDVAVALLVDNASSNSRTYLMVDDVTVEAYIAPDTTQPEQPEQPDQPDQPSDPTGIADVWASNIVVFPNPSSDNIVLNGVEGSAEVALIDVNGRMVMHIESLGEGRQIDISSLTKGIYHIRISNDKGTTVKKLIVQ